MEKRKYQRQSASKEISFTTSLLDFGEMRRVNGSALTLNKSKGGACIKTTIALEPGHVLRILSDSRMRVAVVKWTKIEDYYYIAGLKN
ncbi:MAG: hypothetical protein HZA14_11640 [Nitrospirae bacterium]|nr:hypothetical protein [Nitrospirota bacterium]